MVRKNPRHKPVWTTASDPQPLLVASLSDLKPLRLERLDDSDGRQLWNALVARHHYLGYRKPFGEHLRYFITARTGNGSAVCCMRLHP
ncbi:MAG: DUF4338 domain-containing protein [Aestuariivita sp.]|nr:DUF4338 domain-containing protein [Aestuariivita sp.]MCY4203645.1 DUF4338 domain-containing protein [Aestuariivita sp.]MCY4288723.1 DUF4338 domain-containing protein [Aestuariivita sp.]MCY4347838.1 DUF4338 domain-containing protein [Aestuariivita sp.]